MPIAFDPWRKQVYVLEHVSERIILIYRASRLLDSSRPSLHVLDKSLGCSGLTCTSRQCFPELRLSDLFDSEDGRILMP